MAILTQWPLQRRIMVLVAGGLVFTLLAAAAIARAVVARSTARVLEERLLMARVGAAELDERLGVSLRQLEGIGEAIGWSGRGALPPAGRRLLELSMSRAGLFSGGFAVLDTRRQVIWSSPGHPIPSADSTLSLALSGSPAVSGFATLLAGAHPAVVMWVPLRHGDAVVGVLGGIIDLRSPVLGDLIRPLATGRTGHAVIVDRNGIVLAGTEAHELFTRGDHPDFFTTLIAEGRAGVGRTPEIENGVAGEDHVMAFAPLTIGQWGLGFGHAAWEVFQLEQALVRRLLVLALILVLAGLLFAWRDTGVITAPLRRLTAAAQGIAAGDLASPIPAAPGFEVGSLSRALEAMRMSLRQMRDELEQRAAVIARREREARALYDVSRAILGEDHLSAVLGRIAASARTLFGSAVAGVCLWDGAREQVVPGAFDGPEDAFVSADGPVACQWSTGDGEWWRGGPCPFIRAEFRQAHVRASVRAGGRLVGFMCVGSPQVRPFGEEDASLLTGLANLAAIAIESTQLRDRVQHLAVLEERERIGMDLHDSIIQSLYGLSLSLEHCQRLVASSPAVVTGTLDGAIDAIAQVIRDIRTYVMGLRSAEGEARLAAALGRVVDEFRVNTLLPVTFRADDDLPALDPDARLHLQLLLREALANVARHAGAGQVRVEAVAVEETLRLTVADDGRGFDVQEAANGRGLGLRTMTERARRMGGALTIRSAAGGGTSVEVTLPFPQTASHEVHA